MTRREGTHQDSALAHGDVVTWAGRVRVAAGLHGVREAEIPPWTEDMAAKDAMPANSGAITIYEGSQEGALRYLRQALTELHEYFSGIRRDFTVALDPQGTAFYQAAWAEVGRVPYGETRSYAEIAQAIDAPAAVRAVGAANGANPVAPFVPCHRIVGSNGRLTGYGPGLPLKARLLAMEGAIPADAGEYDAWAAALRARHHGQPLVLGVRATLRYCVPGCARSRASWALPARIFASAEQADAAGYAPCLECQPGR